MGTRMSERSDLEKRAAELAEAIGEELDPRKLSNKKLAERVEELEQELPEHERKQRETEIIERSHAAKAEIVNASANDCTGAGMRYAHEVPPGTHLKCRIGVLKGGAQVKREWVGGIDRLDELVGSGSVLRGPLAKRFEVAPKHELKDTTRGILTAGMRVEPEYVGGEIVLERLIQEGHVKRNPVPQER